MRLNRSNALVVIVSTIFATLIVANVVSETMAQNPNVTKNWTRKDWVEFYGDGRKTLPSVRWATDLEIYTVKHPGIYYILWSDGSVTNGGSLP